MRNKLSSLIAALFVMLGQRAAYADADINHSPSETILLILPSDTHKNLVGTERYVSPNYGLFECCPITQADQYEGDIIGVLFQSREDVHKKFESSIETIIDFVCATMDSYSEDSKVTWNVIEKNEKDVIYEWYLHRRHKKSPEQHVVARSFLTESGYHTVRISRGKGEMSLEERGKNIQLLKETASIVPFEKAALHPEGISLVERLNVLDFGDAFEGWRMFRFSIYGNYSLVYDSIKNEEALHESLKVAMRRIVNGMTICPFFEMEKMSIKRGAKIRILKRSPTEIIYSYTYKDDGDHFVGVVRSFVEGQGYYSISYEIELPHKLKNQAILQVKEELEKLKVCNGENDKYPHFIKLKNESCFH